MRAENPEGVPAASVSPSDESPATARPAALTGQQRALLQALEERNPVLGTIYLGGLIVLEDTANPDRFALCAHGMRELMEKLPDFLDVSTKAQKESLKAKVREMVEDAFVDMQKKTACYSATNGWDGAVDGHLRKFLLQIGNFLDWFASHRPRRRAELHGALVRLDGSGRDLPAPLASLNVDDWDKKRDYFQSVAHHRRSANESEFRQWMDALECFLLERLVPRTFDDFAEIDALLEEESGDA
jgi:hypothetical protein